MPLEMTSLVAGLWSAEERLLFDALRPHCTTSEIAEIFKLSGFARTLDAIDRRGRRTGIKFLGLGQPNLEELTPLQLEAVEKVLGERTGISFETEEEELSGHSLLDIREPPRPLKSPATDEIRSRLREIAAELPSEYPKVVRPEGGSTCVLLLSDLHFGKIAEGFNMAVAHERISTIPERLSSYLPKDCNEVIVLLAGDLVEGEDIYPNQNCHVEVPLIEQVYGATRAIWLMLRKFSNSGMSIKVYTCPGNHGRMSKTANEKSNWDNVVYQELGLVAEIARDPNIDVNVNYEEFCRFPIRDKWGLMYHQGTKHTGTASMQVRLMGWLHTKPWEIFHHGHHHTWSIGTIFGRPVVANGSLPGPDDLAERMGVTDPPRQAYYFARDKEPFFGFGYLEWS